MDVDILNESERLAIKFESILSKMFKRLRELNIEYIAHKYRLKELENSVRIDISDSQKDIIVVEYHKETINGINIQMKMEQIKNHSHNLMIESFKIRDMAIKFAQE